MRLRATEMATERQQNHFREQQLPPLLTQVHICEAFVVCLFVRFLQ